LDEIPGVDTALAGAIIAELGADMSVFENVSQLASWAGVTRNLVYRLGYTVTLELKAA
jgi:transposase